MPNNDVRLIPVAELFSASNILSLSGSLPCLADVHVPRTKTTTVSGLPILALYKGSVGRTDIYLLITRELRGFVFDHYYYEKDTVQVTEEAFTLSEKDVKEVEEFLSIGYHLQDCET